MWSIKSTGEATTDCWEILDPKVFDTLVGLIVNSLKTIIKVDGWYTKYSFLLYIYMFSIFF